MGTTGGKQKSNTTATTVQTPSTPSWLSQPYQQYASSVAALPQDASLYTTPATANQTQAFARAGAMSGADPTAGAQTATGGLLNWTPQAVTAGQLRDTDLSAYMNPYEQDVINSTVDDFSNANAIGLNQLRASTPTGAFNGSRAGVAEGALTSGNTRSLAQLIASLRSNNYGQAQASALTDIGNRFSADQFNSQQDAQGAQFRLSAADQLARLGLAGSADQRAGIQQQADLGAQERAIASENNPYIALLNLLQTQGGLLGQVPIDAFTGQTQTQTGQTRTSTNAGLLSLLGTMAQGAGSMMPSGGGKG